MHDCAGDNFPPQCYQMVQDCNSTTIPSCAAPFVAGYFYSSSVRELVTAVPRPPASNRP